MNNRNIDINNVVAVYQEKINELQNENIVLKALLRQIESENQSKETI